MTDFIKKIKLKNLQLKNNLFLSPMAGIGGYAFRKICLENGCGLAISEMVSSESVFHKNAKSIEMLKIRDDRPSCIQIFGTDPEKILFSALLAVEKGAEMIELNAGCPVKKITKTGAGAALMKNPTKLSKIIETLALKLKVPVSVKIRTGWEGKSESAIELASIIENSGADCLHIHLRSVSQIHSGEISYETGRKIREKIKIPIIANGGINSYDLAKKMFEMTNCDAISIGRAAVSNPQIFNEIYLRAKGVQMNIHNTNKKELFLKFLRLNCDVLGEEKGIKNSRKIAGLWFKNFPNATKLRNNFMKVQSLSEAEKLIKLEG